MRYPDGLTPEQINRVERARDLAELELRKRLKADKNPHRLNLARDFVFSVFKVLSKQMAEAEGNGVFGGSYGRNALDHFVQFVLVPHVYDLSDIEHYYIGFQTFPVDLFRDRLMDMLHDSELWTEYLEQRLAAWSEVPGRAVTAALVLRRRNLVKQSRLAKGMTVADFARYAGMSDSAIRGIVKEDRSRYNNDSQKRLLDLLGVTIDEWYRL